ncbi:endonuclease domain-containing 1 protein [Oreochromis niloticus]|uniref:Endonuclease domain-containing 1 protein n=2 Tax=Oreochromis TaxID=8139 RepID=A0A669AXC6_ORENI|nr:endonuclease domain-containing 1 protein [Oreochromis niloticus]XP_031594495.2 endonuclease domain-containing 1 protein-like isoform X1 [Oreochromis aureus]CAI5681849.1 unnamed protein product [Mustela putorius furo]
MTAVSVTIWRVDTSQLRMSSIQTYFLSIPALLFQILLIDPTLAEVVTSISICKQFLLEETPPQVPGVLESGNIVNQNQYKPICQTYKNKRRFLTLYDIKNKIPVFSAYKYIGDVAIKRPRSHWQIEPQLENENDSNNMRRKDKEKIYNHQAVDIDFKSNGTYDKGHIFPSSHAFTKDDKLATFTLTNIVPQARTFNQGSWNKMERCIKCVMDKYCKNSSGVTEAFVITGAQPSSNNVLNNKINIPSMLWSAFCCYSSNMDMWIASAHWGENVPDESKHKYLQTETLSELHNKLRTADSEFNMFPGTQCPLHKTVSQLYPDIKNCFCPSSISTTSAPSNLTTATPTPPSGSTTLQLTPTLQILLLTHRFLYF